MNGSTFSEQRVLMEYGNHRALLSFHVCPNGTYGDIIQLVIVNATYINLAMRLRDDPNVVACNASVTAPVN